MPFNREIGMKIGSSTIDRSTIALQIIIICLSCSTTIVESAALYPRAKKRQSYDLYWKNRQRSLNKSFNEGHEYDGALSYRDLFKNNKANGDTNFRGLGRKSRDPYTSRNQIARSSGDSNFDRSDGMTRIFSFPLKGEDSRVNRINGFAPGDPAGDCLAGGLDAGVINGALKIGIGFGLAPGCGTSTEQAPKMVPVPVFLPRPIPVPVAVPQPYPVAIDRPVAIRVPQPIPFPAFNMGPLPAMGSMQQLPSRLMTGRACLFQNCIIPPGPMGAGNKRHVKESRGK